MVLAYPVEYELVGGQKAQAVRRLDGMQGTYPGVELLFGKLGFKTNQTLLP
jgi:hypothetical protein